ncbi:MAG: hypothetical protein GY868_09415 [Deltaproteobacteria bacterium]|nr:hypothetical protein [Deltaproteobacteria bacterium]
MRERSIIHLNVADFAVAVERVVDRRLQDRPVIVAPDGAVRATVYDMSDEAYQSGVYKGMPLKHALRRCRDAVVLPVHFDRYERAMADLFKHSLPYSPLVEIADHNGHVFLDATGTGRLFGPPPDIAWRIRKSVRADMGVDPIWSVAPNKLIAKVATRLVKPLGEYIVREGEETSFLNPLPMHFIPGIDKGELMRLREFNLNRVEQVAALTLAQLDVMVGRRSHDFFDLVRGIDPSPVVPVGEKQPVVRVDHEFGDDTNSKNLVERTLFHLVEKAGAQLRRRKLAARRVGILIDYSDGRRVARQASAKPALNNDFYLFPVAALALKRAWTRRVRIRHLRLMCDRLIPPPAQMELFPECQKEKQQHEKLINTIDSIRSRFGETAICRGGYFSKAFC